MLTLRRAIPEDAREVAHIHVRSWQAAYRGLLPDEYLAGLRPENRMTRYTFDSPEPGLPDTLVAVRDGAVCGFVTTGPCEDDEIGQTGEVLALYVDPGSWGIGAGRALMQEARVSLSAQGFTDAVLWVLAGNRRGERFYARDGWTPDGGHRQVRVWGVDVNESRYHRRRLT